jgi:isopentenyl diphosphate isomerase/L-lactate dehydrogenase-like FMN-dependent dehydrogenase
MTNLRTLHSVDDLRRAARRRLPRAVFDVIDGGAGDELTLRANRAAFERHWLRPRALTDVSRIDTSTTVFGDRLEFPLLLAPCSFARMCHSDAEPGVARAAGRAGTVFVVAGGASERPEVVARHASGPLWYQLYPSLDPGANADLLQRVAGAGYRVLVVTIDTPISPYREKDLRNGVSLPVELTPKLLLAGVSKPAWTRDFLLGDRGAGFRLTAAKRAYDRFEGVIAHKKCTTIEDIAWLRERWAGPLVVKGVLRADEIPAMLAAGVDGIVVSNHGGRNLDGARPTLDALPEIVEAVDGAAEVFLDSGVRRGTDVFRALALGARACLVGKPYMYALAAGGERGVDRLLELLRNEIYRAMVFAGAAEVADIDASMLAPATAHDRLGGWR